jgi:cytochrome oxidase Cu insertion factor (SCO1/SenC/PrrC family)
VLRYGFGLLWLLDGLLQLQSSMPLGFPNGVLSPAAQGSPSWVASLVNFSVRVWSEHPVAAAAATVWIQAGLGLLLVLAPRGRWSRLAGIASAGWGLVVWIFGEALGGILAPGGSVLFGLPGAAVLYVVAGVLLALPEATWRRAQVGRRLLQVFGAFFAGMAVLQAWPGRAAWSGHGTAHTGPGLLTAMVAGMASTPEPSLFSGWVHAFASFDAAHGFAVNLVVVIALGGIGVLLLSGRRALARAGLIAAAVFCLATWVLVQDFGFFGGVGTDPNSMLPLLFLVLAGYVAFVHPSAGAPSVLRPVAAGTRWLDRATPTYLLQFAAAVCAGIVVLVGAAPMALASANGQVDPLLASAAGSTPKWYPVGANRIAASPLPLINQVGRAFSLHEERGRVVVLTFLDPLCTSDCPYIAQELLAADTMLGRPSGVQFVAVDANPLFTTTSDLRAFLRAEGLAKVPNWTYLTGSLPALQTVWASYSVQADVEPAGAMVDHSDVVYVIDSKGVLRVAIPADPLGSSTLRSSFSSLVVQAVNDVRS